MTYLGAIVESEHCEVDKQTGRPNGCDASCLVACTSTTPPQARLWYPHKGCNICLRPTRMT